MSAYHSFITGLPDLDFNLESNPVLSVLYPGILGELLPERELAWVRLLWLRKFHQAIATFLVTRDEAENLPPDIPVDAFSSAAETLDLLPDYLRKLVIWKEQAGKEAPVVQVVCRLQQFYYRTLLCSGNRFIRLWGESELNLLNFLAARRAELLGKDKADQLIPGNDYRELLLEFTSNQKICHTEFDTVSKVEPFLDQADILVREQEIDRVRWNRIDDLNRFEYFSVDVILGYFQKLLILERWKKLLQPEQQTDLLHKAEKILTYN